MIERVSSKHLPKSWWHCVLLANGDNSADASSDRQRYSTCLRAAMQEIYNIGRGIGFEGELTAVNLAPPFFRVADAERLEAGRNADSMTAASAVLSCFMMAIDILYIFAPLLGMQLQAQDACRACWELHPGQPK